MSVCNQVASACIFGQVGEQERLKLLNLLHSECDKEVPSFQRIQDILERDPTLALEKNQDGKLALHLACGTEHKACSSWIDACFFHRPKKSARTYSYDSSFYESNGLGKAHKIIQLLVDVCPKSAQVRDNVGQLPLHLVCQHGAPLVAVHAVLQAYPQASSARSRVDGRMPLHMACARNASHEVILYLIQQNPQAIDQQDSLGFTPLHLVCGPDGQADVLDAFLSHPQGIHALEKQTYETGHLPLHLACRRGASHFLVERLVQACPEGCKMLDKDQKWLALHYACARLNRAVVEILIKAFPGSVLVRDPCGRLPFHIAYDRNASMGFLKLLISDGEPILHFCLKNGLDERFFHSLLIRCPETVSQCDQAGFLPIHCASSLQPPNLNVIELLISEDKDSLVRGDNNGDCPFHLACNSHTSLKVLRILMPDPVQFSRIPNQMNELAIHLACRHGASNSVLRFLKEANPDASVIRNNKGDLPVHCLANRNFSLDQAQFAVEEFSATLQMRNHEGLVPLHLACVGNAPLDSVYTVLRFYPDILKAPVDHVD